MAGQGRAQGQVGTWPRPGMAGAAAPWLVPAGLAGPLAEKLREWAAVKPIKNFCGACRQKINLVWRTTCLVGIGEQVIAPTAQVPAELSVSPQYRRNNPTILPWMRTRLGGRMRTS